MYSTSPVFSQVMSLIHRQEFSRCVDRYGGDARPRGFSCRDQFLCMAFGQMTFRESLRDLEACLRARPELLYHLGLRGRVSRSTLAEANERHDWRIYADLAAGLIDLARRLYASEPMEVDLANTVYALDSTTIDLCLSLFPWAYFRSTKSAIKLHALLDLRGSIPSFILITEAALADVNLLDSIPFEAGAFYLIDRGYLDFARLFVLHQARAFFVIRAKSNLAFLRYRSEPVDPATGLLSDQIGRLRVASSRHAFPDHLRLVAYRDPATGKKFKFLTNHLRLPALTICQLYHQRWQIELFFKSIKQHLVIKRFLGTSDNAVKTQIWIALSVYLLAAIIRKQLNSSHSLHTVLQILSVHPFDHLPLHQLLASHPIQNNFAPHPNQLSLFNL